MKTKGYRIRLALATHKVGVWKPKIEPGDPNAPK